MINEVCFFAGSISNNGNGLNVINSGTVEFNDEEGQAIAGSNFTDGIVSNMTVSTATTSVGLIINGGDSPVGITGKLLRIAINLKTRTAGTFFVSASANGCMATYNCKKFSL